MATQTETAPKPSAKQVYFIARLALRYAGHELPDTRLEASELIQTLIAAIEAKGASDEIPF